jgi:hypothetical protein
MSCDLRVLTDQPTEAIPSGNLSSRRDDRWFGRFKGRCLRQGAVLAVAVVMVNVLGQHGLQLSTSEDEHPVQHLTPNRAHPPLRVGIRPWHPHRSVQHLEALLRLVSPRQANR